MNEINDLKNILNKSKVWKGFKENYTSLEYNINDIAIALDVLGYDVLDLEERHLLEARMWCLQTHVYKECDGNNWDFAQLVVSMIGADEITIADHLLNKGLHAYNIGRLLQGDGVYVINGEDGRAFDKSRYKKTNR